VNVTVARPFTKILVDDGTKAMGHATRIDEYTHDLAAPVDPDDLCRCAARGIDCGDHPIVQQIAVGDVPGIEERAHDLTAFGDPVAQGMGGARDVDLGETALVPEKAMNRAPVIDEAADDLAPVIDSEGDGTRRARDIDGSEGAPWSKRKPWLPAALSKSLKAPTIWPRSLIPTSNVSVAPGKSICVKLPFSKRKP
jgi:hypothetical protein